jgi:hypothetical protein
LAICPAWSIRAANFSFAPKIASTTVRAFHEQRQCGINVTARSQELAGRFTAGMESRHRGVAGLNVCRVGVAPLAQFWKTIDPDSVTNRFGYNSTGECEVRAIDLDNKLIDTNDVDRVTSTFSDVVTNSTLGANLRRTQTYVWGTNDDNTATLISTVETAVNGLTTWDTIRNNGVGVATILGNRR